MTQFLYLLGGIAIGWLLLKLFRPKTMGRVVFMAILFPLSSFVALWVLAFLSEPETVLVYPDPVYFPNYVESQQVPWVDRILNGLEKSTKTFVYGYIGLGITIYFRGRDEVKAK
jgi:hypothetical protein